MPYTGLSAEAVWEAETRQKQTAREKALERKVERLAGRVVDLTGNVQAQAALIERLNARLTRLEARGAPVGVEEYEEVSGG